MPDDLTLFDRLRMRIILADIKVASRFGKKQDCGCVRFLGSTRVFCWPHACETTPEKK